MSTRDDILRSDVPLGERERASAGFTTTHWSVVLLAGQEGSAEAASALENLCRTYWYPLYAYARRQGHSPPDGEDLTQQFFAGFLEKKYFGLANPGRGRFRSFLLASFKHFLTNEYHRTRAVKRGGGASVFSWDAADTEERYRLEPASETAPDKLFERTWVLTLLNKVMKDLQQEYLHAGKGHVFEALQIFLSGDRSEATYAEVGRGVQMSESAVKMAVSRLRQRYGERLRNEIANTVDGPAAVEEELRHLFSTLA